MGNGITADEFVDLLVEKAFVKTQLTHIDLFHEYTGEHITPLSAEILQTSMFIAKHFSKHFMAELLEHRHTLAHLLEATDIED